MPPTPEHIEYIKNLENLKGLYTNDYFAAYFILGRVKLFLLSRNKESQDIDMISKFEFMEHRLKFISEEVSKIIDFINIGDLAAVLGQLNEGSDILWETMDSYYANNSNGMPLRS